MKWLILFFLLLFAPSAYAWQYRVMMEMQPKTQADIGKLEADIQAIKPDKTSIKNENSGKTEEGYFSDIIFKLDSDAIIFFENSKLLNVKGRTTIHKCMHKEYGEIKNSLCTIEEETVLTK